VIFFTIGIHNHQPVGNFDSVFREAMEKAYLPFLETLSRHPGVKISIHNSGILYDWFEENGRKYLDILSKLVERGQVELLTGGFYEPILPAIPERDGVGQIRMLNSYISKRFGTKPVGYWTAERVWEPHLPRILKNAGVRYTLLDDYHFRAAGLSESRICGYYLTEHEGDSVAVFPISRDLRYIFPFKMVSESIEYLRQQADARPGSLIVFADDGEKFGIWPGTYQWVIEERWLENFFTELERNADWIRTMTFSEAIESTESSGIVYLPTASYHEMMEWALFDEARVAFHNLEEELKSRDLFDRLDTYAFMRGGFWRNFLAKYPESNMMHKKMMRVSRKIEEASCGVSDEEGKAKLDQAREKLWAGQCNCPYWHGVFGGLYLPHLRAANYGSLLAAENIVDGLQDSPAGVNVDIDDYDGDGTDEVILESRNINVFVSPQLGAQVQELDYRPLCVNLMDVMRRKLEPYHQIAEESGNGGGDSGDSIPSIHNIAREQGLDPSDFVTDPHKKMSFIDHFLEEGISFDDFVMNRYTELGDFAYRPYFFKNNTDGGRVTLSCSREANLQVSDRRFPFHVRKRYELAGGANILKIVIELTDLSVLPCQVKYGLEFSIGEIPGEADGRYMIINQSGPGNRLGAPGAGKDVFNLLIRDEWRGFTADIIFSMPVTLWFYPIHTHSQSEGGFEKIYQGTTFLATIPIGPPHPGRMRLEMTMKMRGGSDRE